MRPDVFDDFGFLLAGMGAGVVLGVLFCIWLDRRAN
jgi:hypothetical protein